MQGITDIGFNILVAVAVFVIGTWVIGRYLTAKLRSRIGQDIAGRFPATTSKVSVRLLGNIGAKFSYHQKSDSPLPKLESTIMLLDRSNIFHFVYCKARHRTDQLQIRANLLGAPPFNLELANRAEQKSLLESLRPEAKSIHEITIEDATDRFYVVVSDIESAKSLFNSSHFRTDFDAVAPYLTRLSIARKEPQLFASVVLTPEAMQPVENFIFSLAKSLQGKRK